MARYRFTRAAAAAFAAAFAAALLQALPCAAAESAETACDTPRIAGDPAYGDFDFAAEREPLSFPDTVPIKTIALHRQNIFPDADHLLARVANRLNILTRESTLRAALPFVEGDAVSRLQIEEAERILRRKPFLYDARVLVREHCEDGLVLDVIVRDVWTLAPSLGFTRSGGDNKAVVGFTDSNIAGSGKALAIEYRSDRDRSGVTFSYRDPNVAGSRWTAALTASSNDDGDGLGARIERPFFALDTNWSMGLGGGTAEREQDLEFLSEPLYTIDARQRFAETYLGYSRGRVARWVDRFRIGVALEEEDLDFPAGFPGETRIERRFAYPFLGWQRIEDRFVTRENIERVERTEDLRLGLAASARLGWSSPRFGGEGEYLLFQAAASKSWYLTARQLLSAGASVSGRYATGGASDTGGTENLIFRSEIEYLWRHDPRFNLLARVRYVETRDLDPEAQLTLGGDTDLRGYPSRYQPGDRAYLATLEERYYSSWFPFGLFRVGIAAFVDVGRAWYTDDPPAWVPDRSGDHFGTLSNVGVGLRLESVRTRRDRVLHIDVARPLVDGPGIDGVQLIVTAKRSL